MDFWSSGYGTDRRYSLKKINMPKALIVSVVHTIVIATIFGVSFGAMKLLGMTQPEALALFLSLVGAEKFARESASVPVPDYVANPPFCGK